MVRPPRSCLEVPRVAERPPPCRRHYGTPDSEPRRFCRARWKRASKTGQAARQNARTSAENQLGSGAHSRQRSAVATAARNYNGAWVLTK